MYHGVMHQGAFDANIRALAPGKRTYVDGGVVRDLPRWPELVDGIRFGVLERARRLLLVRLEFAEHDVILEKVVPLEITRHLGGGHRPGEDVVVLSDQLAERILDDVLAANPEQRTEIALLVNRVNQVRRASREAGNQPGRTG